MISKSFESLSPPAANGFAVDGVGMEREKVEQKISRIAKFIIEHAPDANGEPRDKTHDTRDRVATMLEQYQKTSWSITDQTVYPNTEIKAPHGIWGSISPETPDAPVPTQEGSAPAHNDWILLTLHKISSTQIQVRLLKSEKEAVLESIASLRTLPI